MRHLFKLLLVCGLVWLVVSFWNARPIRHTNGILVPVEPMQENVAPTPLPGLAGFQLTGVARYAICGRVLGTKRYWDPPASDLVPVDVALGWGSMSDQAVLDQLGLSMGNRFFFYEWRNAPPVALPEIIRHAANHHVISASPGVKAGIKSLRRGEIVVLRGWLVDAAGPDGYTWNTSQTRDDSGRGACELFYVEAIDKLPPDAMAALRTQAAERSAVAKAGR